MTDQKPIAYPVGTQVRVRASSKAWPGERGEITRVFPPPRTSHLSVCYFVRMASDGHEVAFFEAELEVSG